MSTTLERIGSDIRKNVQPRIKVTVTECVLEETINNIANVTT